MSNSNNNLSTSFENVFKKHKNIVLAIPVVLLGLILGIYYTSAAPTNDNQRTENVVDTSIPSAETKPLSDSKVEVATDYEMMTEENQKKINEADAIDLSDPNVSSNQSSTYEKPDDEVIKKVDKMLVEMNNSSKKNKSTSINYNRSNSAPKREVVESESMVDKQSNYAKESLNDFFSSRDKVQTNSTEKQSDPFIYAAIKGDQLGIKNGQRVVLMLAKKTVINGRTFLKNTTIYAQAEFKSSRINFNISSINQIPMSLKAYDAEDGALGLNVNQSLLVETSSEVASDATDEVDVTGIPLGNTIKNLLKKKQRIPKIDLLNNQKLILKL
jgi:uncharacterized membrane-anchored protein